jgi:hypothetical protein
MKIFLKNSLPKGTCRSTAFLKKNSEKSLQKFSEQGFMKIHYQKAGVGASGLRMSQNHLKLSLLQYFPRNSHKQDLLQKFF